MHHLFDGLIMIFIFSVRVFEKKCDIIIILCQYSLYIYTCNQSVHLPHLLKLFKAATEKKNNNNNNCRDGKSLFTLTSMSKKKKQRVTFMSPTHSYESDELKGIVGELSYQHV